MANGNGKKNGNGNGMSNGRVSQTSPEFKRRLARQQRETERETPSRTGGAKGYLRAGLEGAFGSGLAGRAKDTIQEKKAKERQQIKKQTGM